jgi:hypothetical protein
MILCRSRYYWKVSISSGSLKESATRCRGCWEGARQELQQREAQPRRRLR